MHVSCNNECIFVVGVVGIGSSSAMQGVIQVRENADDLMLLHYLLHRPLAPPQSPLIFF